MSVSLWSSYTTVSAEAGSSSPKAGEAKCVKPSRSSILYLIVLGVILGSLPAGLVRLAHTGPYLFTTEFFKDLVARLLGAGRIRFILQPTIAIVIGVRQGLADARADLPNFLYGLAFHAQHRGYLVRSSVSGVRDLVAIAILLDIISQAIIFREIHAAAALILGPALIAVPYSVARALSNLIYKARKNHASAASAN